MDVSSRYYNSLKNRDRNFLKHPWGFLLSICRVGKLRELSSFCYGEVNHPFKLYRPSRYILFHQQACLVLNHRKESSNQVSLVNDQHELEAVGFERLMIDGKYCVAAADYTLWGCRFSNPNALYHSDGQLSSPVLVHSFTGPIASMFIRQDTTLFVYWDGTRNEVRLVTSSVNPSDLLYISITYYSAESSQLHTHQLYSLK